MKTTTVITTCAAACAAPIHAAEPPEVRLVQYQVGAALSDRVPFEVKPMGHEYGAKLALLIEGENLVAIKDDSLELKAMTGRDGEEISSVTGRGGKWEQGSFPRVSEDGSLASFSIIIRDDLMGRLEGAGIEGAITIRTASETETAGGTLEIDGEEQEFGPFEVGLVRSEGFGGDPTLGVRVVGDHGAITEVSLKAGGQTLESNSSSWSGDTKTFSFPNAEADEGEVSLTFWTDLEESELPFTVTIGGE